MNDIISELFQLKYPKICAGKISTVKGIWMQQQNVRICPPGRALPISNQKL